MLRSGFQFRKFSLAGLVFVLLASITVSARSWQSAGQLIYPEGEAYLLNDGRVFAPAIDYLHPGSQVWDPATKIWTGLPNMQNVRFSSATVVLNDGRVLVTGGLSGSMVLNSAEIYDPVTNTWKLSSSVMKTARYQHRATKLQNGRILIVGGCSSYGCGSGARQAELYDPATDSFSTSGSLNWNTTALTSNLLKNGAVLITGGTTTAEIYNPKTGKWLFGGNLSTNRVFHAATALSNGKVLVTGGSDSYGALLKTAEVFDPTTRTWTSVGNMSVVREQHATIPVPGGRVLIAGGMSVLRDMYVVLNTTELFDSSTGKFTPMAPMMNERVDFGLVVLPSGHALAVGGDYYVIEHGFYPGDAEIY